MFESFFFYIFSILALVLSSMVITLTNPVYSVLFLVLVFLTAAAFALVLQLEFMALLFVLIYVGAIAVLFLFVVMMLDIKVSKEPLNLWLPFSTIGILALSREYFFGDAPKFLEERGPSLPWIQEIDFLGSIENLSQVLYTQYIAYFLIAGILLLVAMTGAIVLTLGPKAPNQSLTRQLGRQGDNAIFVQE
uniref:NADH-ubiquinone oxidoreductase chain 6 n=1 Tax=Schizocladia ischiensis TaxID=196139 RepID=A0A7S6ZPD3_9STRA|nr:Nad6 [Schizocladia ischiensis]QOW07609.1 Nad6 [Schizocladia ischiensis]